LKSKGLWSTLGPHFAGGYQLILAPPRQKIMGVQSESANCDVPVMIVDCMNENQMKACVEEIWWRIDKGFEDFCLGMHMAGVFGLSIE